MSSNCFSSCERNLMLQPYFRQQKMPVFTAEPLTNPLHTYLPSTKRQSDRVCNNLVNPRGALKESFHCGAGGDQNRAKREPELSPGCLSFTKANVALFCWTSKKATVHPQQLHQMIMCPCCCRSTSPKDEKNSPSFQWSPLYFLSLFH